MIWADILILAVLAAGVFAACKSLRQHKGGCGGCCGECRNCSACTTQKSAAPKPRRS